MKCMGSKVKKINLFSLRLTKRESVLTEVIIGFGDGLIGGIIAGCFATNAGRPADVARTVEVCSER